MIGTDTETGTLRITICNYNAYQKVGLPDETDTGTDSGTAAGQQRDKEETGKHINNTSSLRSEEKYNAPAREKNRGFRLPDDWMPDEIFAKSEGLSAPEVAREADKFRDYWRSQSGQKGVKLDWQATWKNWVRKVADGRKPQVASSDWRSLPEYRGVL